MRQALGCGLTWRKSAQSSAVRAVTQASSLSPVQPVPGAARASRQPGCWRATQVSSSPYWVVTRNCAHVLSCVQYAPALSAQAFWAEVLLAGPSTPASWGASLFVVASPPSRMPPSPPADALESPPLAQAEANASRTTAEEKANPRIRR